VAEAAENDELARHKREVSSLRARPRRGPTHWPRPRPSWRT
jgi:hypothetical protein